MFFWFKRVVGMLMQPLMLAYLLIVLAALVTLLRRRRFAKWAMILVALVLIAATLPPLTRWSARRLESAHAPFAPAGSVPADRAAPYAIVVLGNGVAHPGDSAMPALSRLNDTARARLVEGVRLARLYPEALLVTTGYGLGLENCADAMAGAAEELGVAPDRIHRLAQSVDTAHEARLVGEMAGERPVLLVTSAVHMPRTMAYFREQGVDAAPAPCDYIAPVSDRTLAAVNRYRWRPRGKNLSDSEETWHELMGLAYFHWFRREGAED